MAERRMFSLQITESDAFLDMPLSAQALYFHLGMYADDDGFIGGPKKIQRMLGCGSDDLKLLAAKRFIIPFESGVVVIKHWKINNLIRSDRYKETVYKEEKELLIVKENKGYTIGIPKDNQRETQVRLGKDSIGKDRIVEDIKDICPEPEPALDLTAAISFTLNDNSEYWIFEDQVKEWTELFPAVDVMQELRKMKNWLNSNPSRRKTKRGILRFVNGWLCKEQDRPKAQRPLKQSNETFYDDMARWVNEHECE